MLNKKQTWAVAICTIIAGALYEVIGSILPAVAVIAIGAVLAYKFQETPLTYKAEFRDGEDTRAIRNTGRGSTFISPNPTVETIRNGYHDLIDIIQHDGDKDALHAIVDTYDFADTINPEAVLFDLIQSFNKVSSHFLISMDWNADVVDLNWHFDAALKSKKKVKLPKPDQYPSGASIMHGLDFSNPGNGLSQVFDDYLAALNKAGYGICFIDTKSDQFTLALYRLQDRQAVIDAVFHTGLAIGSGR